VSLSCLIDSVPLVCDSGLSERMVNLGWLHSPRLPQSKSEGEMSVGFLPATAGVFVFDEFELDAPCYQLRRRGVEMKLENVPFQLLLLLVEKTGKVVSRKEIAERLWGRRFNRPAY
jgi:hypothetical protein